MREFILKKLKQSLYVQLLIGASMSLLAVSFLAPLLGIKDKDVMLTVVMVMGVSWAIFKVPDLIENEDKQG